MRDGVTAAEADTHCEFVTPCLVECVDISGLRFARANHGHRIIEIEALAAEVQA